MRLQKIASGLLSFFELKTEGENPSQFSDTVMPTVEVDSFYAASQQTVSVVSGNVTVPNDQISIFVPTNQAWRVRALSFTLTVAAATTAVDGAGGYVGVVFGPTGCIFTEQHVQPKVTAANLLVVGGGLMLPKAFLALPGTKIFFNNMFTYSVASSADIRVFFDPIQYP